MHRRDEGWSLAVDASGQRGGKAEPRLLDALRHGRSRTVRRVRLEAGTRVLWEIDAGDELDAFVRAAIERAAKWLRGEERCLAPADQRALRAFEERDADARDLAEAARDEAARRVFDALRAIEERKFAARRNRPDLEDAVRDAQQESARAHAAAAFDDALAHALDPRAPHGKVLDDVARALAWIATAEQGGVSLDWDHELDRVRSELETVLEARLLAIAPAVRPESELVVVAQPLDPPKPERRPLGVLTVAIARRFPEARVNVPSARSDTAEVVFPGAVVGASVHEDLAAIGAAHGWKLIACFDAPEEVSVRVGEPRSLELAASSIERVAHSSSVEHSRRFLAHPLAASAFTSTAIAQAHAQLKGLQPVLQPVAAHWFAARWPWLRCTLCDIRLAPLDCNVQRAHCPRCSAGRLMLIDTPPAPIPRAEGTEPEPMPKGSRGPTEPIEQLVICSACFATASVDTDELALEMCRTCGCIGTLELA